MVTLILTALTIYFFAWNIFSYIWSIRAKGRVEGGYMTTDSRGRGKKVRRKPKNHDEGNAL